MCLQSQGGSLTSHKTFTPSRQEVVLFKVPDVEVADSVKLYAVNTGAFAVSCCDWLEATLKILKKS